MIEGFIVAACSVALGQWIAKWRNAKRTHQPQWPVRAGMFAGRSVARLMGRQNGGKRGGNGRALTHQTRQIRRA